MTAGRGATIARTSYNLPSAITNGSISTQFFYAPDRSYWKQVAVYAAGTETTLYLGGMLEKVTRANGTTDWRHRIATPGAGSILYIRQSTGTNLTYSVAGDHLGSTSVVTDSAQALIVSQSFGAFGARRGSNWQGTPSSGDLTQIEATSRRGFTDHTMVDNLSLIHMNGRMYDPVIGRFLSADPYPLVGRVALADPAGVTTDVTQAFNRYSYVDNNPLSYKDPSGFQKQSCWDCSGALGSGGATFYGEGSMAPVWADQTRQGQLGVGIVATMLNRMIEMYAVPRPTGFTDAGWYGLQKFWRALHGEPSSTVVVGGGALRYINILATSGLLYELESRIYEQRKLDRVDVGVGSRASMEAYVRVDARAANWIVPQGALAATAPNEADERTEGGGSLVTRSIWLFDDTVNNGGWSDVELALVVGHELIHASQPGLISSESRSARAAYYANEVEAYQWTQDVMGRFDVSDRFRGSINSQLSHFSDLAAACASADQACPGP